jgi:hypothetical protein
MKTTSIHMGSFAPVMGSHIPDLWESAREDAGDGFANVVMHSNDVHILPCVVSPEDSHSARQFFCAATGVLNSALAPITIHQVSSSLPSMGCKRPQVPVPATVTLTPLDPATAGTPAGYGNLMSGKTEFDTGVRKARALTASQVRVAINGCEAPAGPVFAALAAEAAEVLFPDDSRAVEFVLNKVNLYGPGDHFARHVDTPASGVVGTLVITCPRSQYPWEGQGLTLHGPPARESDADGSGTGTGSGVSEAQVAAAAAGEADTYATYAMFYSDVVHEVCPVLSGVRVSIAYNIVLKDKTTRVGVEVRKGPAVTDTDTRTAGTGAGAGFATATGTCLTRVKQVPCSASSAWLRIVEDVLASHDFFRGSCDVAVLCTNKYSFDEIEAGLLKGFDAQLVARAKKLKYCGRHSVLPVALRVGIQHYVGGEMGDGEPPKLQMDLYRMTRRDLVRACGSSLADPSIELVCRQQYKLIVPHASLLHTAYMHCDEGAEHTGNQARAFVMDGRYWTACIVIQSSSCWVRAPKLADLHSVGGEGPAHWVVPEPESKAEDV